MKIISNCLIIVQSCQNGHCSDLKMNAITMDMHTHIHDQIGIYELE